MHLKERFKEENDFCKFADSVIINTLVQKYVNYRTDRM